ncbi:MAG: RDD family protein [Candidatus Hodarchaeales archaeon]
MPLCPFCYASVDQGSNYCLNCRKKLPDKQAVPPEPTLSGYPSRSTQPITFRPRMYHPNLKAPLLNRCIALVTDYFLYYISVLLIYFLLGGTVEGMVINPQNFCLIVIQIIIMYGVAAPYLCLKDGIRESRSLGKGMMGLRVVDFASGIPASKSQSCVRNCLCCCFDLYCCFFIALVDRNGRRIGDHIAGTVVILDR